MNETASTVRDDDPALRPSMLAEFVGQREVLDNLSIFLSSAKHRQDAMDHVIFNGPPGPGTPPIARITADTIGVPFRSISTPVLPLPGTIHPPPVEMRLCTPPLP